MESQIPYQVVLIFSHIPHCMGLNSSQTPRLYLGEGRNR